jgi:peptidoglycan hydrolase CwlO-like protein
MLDAMSKSELLERLNAVAVAIATAKEGLARMKREKAQIEQRLSKLKADNEDRV